MKGLKSTFLWILVFSVVVVSLYEIKRGESTTVEQILGEVDEVQREGNVYTFTDDVNCSISSNDNGFLWITDQDLVIDGAGYTLRGNGKGWGVMIRSHSNVTIKNLSIENFVVGISIRASPYPHIRQGVADHKILNNNITVVDTDSVLASHQCGFGIYAEYIENSVISGNTIRAETPEKGIYIGKHCRTTTFFNNTLIDCGFNLDRSGDDVLRDNTLSNNTINGKPVVHLKHVSNRVIDSPEQALLFNCSNMTIKNVHPSNDYRYTIHLDETNNTEVTNCEGHIFLEDCDNNTIHNNHPKKIKLAESNYNQILKNTCMAKSGGITLQKSCNHNEIYWNTFSNRTTSGETSSGKNKGGITFTFPGGCEYNKIYENNITHLKTGIYIQRSVTNSFYKNKISNCTVGIKLTESEQNNIYRNNLVDCEYAVSIRGSDNAVYHNNFIENNNQVSISHRYLFSSNIIYEYSTNNTFDLGYPSGGNYWSDYNGTDTDDDGIGDTPYIINRNNTDHYPLMTPVDLTPPQIYIIKPQNHTYITNSIPLIFTLDENTSQIEYSLDGGDQVTINSNTTLSGLSEGSHWLTVYANDTAGNMGASNTVYFTVDEPVPVVVWVLIAVGVVVSGGVVLWAYHRKRDKTDGLN